MPWWIWVLAAFLLLTIEFFSTTAHIGFFALGAFIVAILVGAGVQMPLWVELLIFSVSSVVLLIFVRPIVVKRLGLSRTPVIDSMIGEQATAMGDIDVAAIGKAELRGSTWNACNVSDKPLARGQRCIVERIEGLTLYIR